MNGAEIYRTGVRDVISIPMHDITALLGELFIKAEEGPVS